MHRRIRLTPTTLALATLLVVSRVAAGAPATALDFPDVFSPARTTADEGAWMALPPPAERYAHSAILDSRRNRMIVFGGTAETDAWALSLADPEGWILIRTSGTPPPARSMLAAVYDPVRDRMIVFGGYTGSFLNDVWALSLAGSPTWSQILPAGSGPVAVAAPTAIYDPVRDRLVVFGGFDGQNPVGTAWALSLSGPETWSLLTPAGWSIGLPRYAHAAAYDPARDRMLIFGGIQQGLRLSDVWACDFSGTGGWYALPPLGEPPTPRFAPAAIYESAGDRLVVYGGYDGQGCTDARALALSGDAAWSLLSTRGPGRWWHSAIYDPSRNRLVAFAGRDSMLRNDTWALSLDSSPAWSELAAAAPSPRQLHSAVMDVDNNALVIFGGYDGKTAPYYCTNDVWKLTLSTPPSWQAIVPAGAPPDPRRAHSAIYDPLRRRMIVFGGYTMNGFAAFSDVWALSLIGMPTWTQLAPTGTPPGAWYGHSAIYDPVRDRMIVFGSGAVWALDLSGDAPAWSDITPASPPGYPLGYPVNSQTGIYDSARDQLVNFLYLSGVYYNYTFTLNLAGTPAWSGGAVPWTALPFRIHQSAAAYDPVGDRMIVFGGASNTAGNYTTDYFNDTWSLSLATGTLWTLLAPAGGPPNGRSGHTATFDPLRNRMIVFGGWDGASLHNDAYALLLSSTVSVPAEKPAMLRLAPARPNPSRGTTFVEFELPEPARAALEVFDLHGRRVVRLAEGMLPAGRHSRTWDGNDASGHAAGAGVFFVRLTANGVSSTRRVVRLEGQP